MSLSHLPQACACGYPLAPKMAADAIKSKTTETSNRMEFDCINDIYKWSIEQIKLLLTQPIETKTQNKTTHLYHQYQCLSNSLNPNLLFKAYSFSKYFFSEDYNWH